MARKRAPRQAIKPAVAASMLYYKKQEFEKFFSFWDSLEKAGDVVEDGGFSLYLEYLRKIYDSAERRGSVEFTKDYLVGALNNLNALEPNSSKRERFAIWFEEVLEKDDEQSFLLPEELFQCYVWNKFLEHVQAVDAKDISYKEKILTLNTDLFNVDLSDDDGFFDLNDIKQEEANNKQFKFYIDVIDAEVKPEAGDFVVIAARPSVGKTTIMLDMALENASRGIKSAFISLEMSKEKLFKKVVNWYKDREVPREEWESVKKEKGFQLLSKNFLGAADISSNPDVFFKKLAKKIREDNDVSIVFIDYLQIARYPQLDEWASLRKLTRDCKTFAKDNGVLVVSSSQVSRESTKYGIDLASLFGSSTIENDTDIVISLEDISRDSLGKGTRLLKSTVLKNRMGERGSEFKLLVNYVTGKFRNYDK